MYRDYIVKQTSDFDSQFKAKTLVGNWYQQRCNPSKPENFHFYKERKQQNNIKPTLSQQSFQNSTSNWLNFQHIPAQQTFKTQYKNNYKDADNQQRHSVLNPFIVKKGQFQKNQDALDQYREKWTKSQHVYDSSRTSVGHAKK